MVVGLNIFSQFFNDYQDCYLIIGGTACDIVIEEAAFTPRTTEDIDIVLIVEALKPQFVNKFWEFIKAGNYQIQQKNIEKRNAYRFESPQTSGFPLQIELFSRVPDSIDPESTTHLTPIPTNDDLSNLSAISLNDDYYTFAIEHSDIKDQVHFAKKQALICLKAFAYLNNKTRKAEGQQVKTEDIMKHKYDIFRMVFLLNPDDSFETPAAIKADLQKFADDIKNDLPDPAIFKRNGFGTQNMETIFTQFLKSFNLKLNE